MLVLFVRSGQMCNQLLSLAAIYSIGIHYGERVYCPIVDKKLTEYFEFNQKEENYLCIGHSRGLFFISKVLNKLGLARKRKYNPHGKKIQIFFNWISFLDESIFIEHVEDIRKCIKINSSIEKSSKEKILKIRNNKDTIVGVHLRRGDYRTYRNGEWFFDDEIIIKYLKNLTLNNNNIKFVLCSNERINLEQYKAAGLDVCVLGNTDIEDLCILSKCDYIIGPPSTYSFWAAMYGNKKRCILDKSMKSCSWNDFKYFEERILEGDYIR